MTGCSGSEGRWERIHDDLAAEAAPLDRFARRDELAPDALDRLLYERAATRAAAERHGGRLGYTLPAGFRGSRTAPLLGSLAPMAGGALQPLFDAPTDGRTHVIDSIPGETVELGLLHHGRPPVVSVDSGDTIVYRNTLTHFLGALRPGVTIEDLANLRRGNAGRGPHSVIGPVAVHGAEPGDAVEVRILRLDPIDYGFNFNQPGALGMGGLPDEFADGSIRMFELDRERKLVRWGAHVALPLAPFQGILGVAAADEEPGSSVPPGPYGGNVDLREQVEGTRIFFPVFRPGALLFTGDSHALQGDGEVNLTAIETAMREARVQVILHKRAPIAWPIAETPTHWIPLATHRDLNEAFKQCLRNTIDFLVRAADMTPHDAYGFASIAVSFRITQVVNLNQGVHAMIPKELFVAHFRAQMQPLRGA